MGNNIVWCINNVRMLPSLSMETIIVPQYEISCGLQQLSTLGGWQAMIYHVATSWVEGRYLSDERAAYYKRGLEAYQKKRGTHGQQEI
jgi:hypothetical protein